MSPVAVAVALLAAAYLVGAVPFGYVVGRLRGVNLFKEGSGNIGATNAGRVLGRRFGVLVFVLDFLKGAVPVAVIVPLARSLAPGAETALGPPDVLRVGAAALAFLGHLFPIHLGFRGGKGVATAFGVFLVLTPALAAIAVLVFAVVFALTRVPALGSLAGVASIAALLLWQRAQDAAILAIATTLLLIYTHRANLAKLRRR
jgi:acyl phosphate:glycerol-3-phosphate acyltransferase